jgi:hypothetical protein
MPESTINKTLLTILTVFTIVSICIGASNMYLELRSDVTELQEDCDLNDMDIAANRNDIHALELQNTRIEGMLGEIKRSIEKGDKLTEDRFNRIFDILSTFEVSN